MSISKFSFVSLFVTRQCNLNCSYCNLPNKDIYTMSGDEWITVINQLAPHTEFFNLIGGEPTLHVDLFKIVKHLNNIGANYSLVTNGTKPSQYYKSLIEDAKVKSIAVSMDQLYSDDGDKRPETMKSILGRDIIRFIANKTNYDGTLIISSIISNVNKFNDLVQFALLNNCKIALSIRQFSNNEYQFNSNNPANNEPNKNNTIEVLKYIVNRYNSLPLLDPFEWYVTMLNRYLFNKDKWKCRHGLTPAVDCNGDLWGCFDYQGECAVNLLQHTRATFKGLRKVILRECKKCSGCTWNCPMVSEMVADGIVEAEFL